MTISKSVFNDLYPLYLADEAGAESQGLVEAYLAEHPEEKDSGVASPLPSFPAVEPKPDAGREAFRLTNRLLQERHWLMVGGLALSMFPGIALPLSGQVDGQMGSPLYASHPQVAGFILLAGLAVWIRFFKVCVRLQATGLAPARSNFVRMMWGFTGFLVGFTPGLAIQYWTGWKYPPSVDLLFAAIAFWMGERTGQLAVFTGWEWEKTHTLFGPQAPEE